MPDPSSFIKPAKPWKTTRQVRAEKAKETVAKITKPTPVDTSTIKPKRPARRAPTARQIKAARLMVENVRNEKPKSQGDILREAGYSEAIATVPAKIVQAPSFQELLAQVIPDDSLTEIHKRLLNTRKIEHMVFPLMTSEAEDSLLNKGQTLNVTDGETLTDQDIASMLDEVGCKVKKIMHSETARHVWYWAHDAAAQSKALELAYKVRGVIQKDNGGGGGVNFNFGTQNFIKEANNGKAIS